VQIIRQCPQSTLTKQQIDILETNLFRLLKEEEHNRESDNDVPGYEEEVELPGQCCERGW
jgi:hypothetical protein